ncbi:MAG: hypothetical protein LBD59_04520, partial [Prevotellaceae bacterium]|nr:hypothetical protein [Prevotellaceae bacterium]
MKITVLCVMLFASIHVFAQRELGWESRSKENAIFGGQANEACVTFSSSQTMLPLFYSNNVRKPPAKTDTIGTNINYHLVFDASKGREANGLTIHVDGFSP